MIYLLILLEGQDQGPDQGLVRAEGHTLVLILGLALTLRALVDVHAHIPDHAHDLGK